MQIGNYNLEIIETEPFKMDGGIVFGSYPWTSWSKKYPADSFNRIKIANRVLLLTGNGRVILVDTGIGEKLDQNLRNHYAMNGPADYLYNSLKDKAINPKDITDVILTHLHFSKAGGATRFVGNDILPAFPNAKYWVQQEQWDWANLPSVKDKIFYSKNDFYPIAIHEQLKIVNGDFKIDEEITIQVVQGHSPGMQILTLMDKNNTILFPSDLIPTALHINESIISSCDLYPLFAIEEKYNLVYQAREENWIIIFPNDYEYIAGTVNLDENGFFMKQDASLLFKNK